MKGLLPLLIYFLSLTIVSGQYTEVINGRYPGLSENPYTLGTRVYQLETDYFRYYDESNTFYSVDRSAGVNMFLRSGLFFERLDVMADVQFRKEHFAYNPIVNTGEYRSGFSRMTLAAKYLIYRPTYKDPDKEIRSWKRKWAFDPKRLIPAVGIRAGWETNWLSKDFKLPRSGLMGALLLQQDFDDWTTLVTDFYAEHILQKDYRKMGLLMSLTYAKYERLSLFVEGQWENENAKNKYYAGGGLAYLVNNDLQVGLHVRSEAQIKYLNLYSTVGLSWRIDHHKDKLKKKKYKTEERVEYEKKGFFSRLFSKKGRRGRIPKKKHYKKKRPRRKKMDRKKRKKRERRKPNRSKRKRRERKHRHSRRSRRD